MTGSKWIPVSLVLAGLTVAGCSSTDNPAYSQARMEEYDRAMAASDRQPPMEAGSIAPLPGNTSSQAAVDRQSNTIVTPPLPKP